MPDDAEIAREVEKHVISYFQPNLDRLLQPVYLTMADTYIAAGGEASPFILESYLPGQVFDIAIHAEWIPPTVYRPLDKDFDPGTMFRMGDWAVSMEYGIDFIRRLKPSIEIIRGIVESEPQEHPDEKMIWQKPTPDEIVRDFLYETGWSKAQLIERMADKLKGYRDAVQACKVQLKTITREPTRKGPTLLTSACTTLAEVLRENAAECHTDKGKKRFANLSPHELRWLLPV